MFVHLLTVVRYAVHTCNKLVLSTIHVCLVLSYICMYMLWFLDAPKNIARHKNLSQYTVHVCIISPILKCKIYSDRKPLQPPKPPPHPVSPPQKALMFTKN